MVARRACTAPGATSARSSLVGEQRVEQRAVARVVHLAREVLEEAVELVEVAVGDGQERAPGRRPAARAIARDLDLQLVAEALDAAGARARGRRGRSARRARRRRGTRAPGSRRCGRAARAPGTACRRGEQPVLARAGEDAGDLVARRAARDASARGHAAPMMVGAADSATVDRMQPLRWDRRPDGLRAPALVCAFKGWNDAGDAASSALQFFGSALGADALRADRPRGVLRLPGDAPARCELVERAHSARSSGRTIEVFEARVPRAPRDLVLLAGPEPSLRWRTFCATVLELAEALGVQLVVTLGALLADVPHSRPVASPAFATDDALVDRLASTRRPTRARPGSSACCTTPASRPACLAPPSGSRARSAGHEAVAAQRDRAGEVS